MPNRRSKAELEADNPELAAFKRGIAGRIGELVKENDDGTQRAAADRIGVTQPALSGLLSGLSAPSSENLAKVAAAYGVTADWLLGLRPGRRDGYLEGAEAVARAVREALAAFSEGRPPGAEEHTEDVTLGPGRVLFGRTVQPPSETQIGRPKRERGRRKKPKEGEG